MQKSSSPSSDVPTTLRSIFSCARAFSASTIDDGTTLTSAWKSFLYTYLTGCPSDSTHTNAAAVSACVAASVATGRPRAADASADALADTHSIAATEGFADAPLRTRACAK